MKDAEARSKPDTPKDANYWRHRALSAEMRAMLLKVDIPPPNREILALRARLIAMEQSRSWKITKPLRYMTEALLTIRRKTPSPTKPEAEQPVDKIAARISTLPQYCSSDASSDWTELVTGQSQNGPST